LISTSAVNGYNVGLNPTPGAMKLGLLEVGDRGYKEFGKFSLYWEVYIDNVTWSLNETNRPQKSWLAGAIKYVGWNRIEINSIEESADLSEVQDWLKPARFFEIYVHDWPSIREALDFVYYDLGRKIAVGTYEDSFVKP
jgi:hypothetical protein